MKRKTVSELRPTDAAYLAGLVDGEGTITLSRRHANERRQLVLSVVSTEPALLDWVVAAVNAGKVTRKRTVSERHAPSQTFSIANRQALQLLRQVAPYLRSYKRCRAELVLDQYVAVTPRNGHYTPSLDAERRAFEARFFALLPGEHATVLLPANGCRDRRRKIRAR